MCTGAEIAIGSALLSGGLQYINQENVAKKKDRVTAAELARQSSLDDQARRTIAATADTFDPTQREQAQTQITDELTEGYLQPIAVDGVTDTALGDTTAGKVSNDFLTLRAGEEARSLKRTTDLAKMLAKIDGGNRLPTEEGYGLSRLGSDLGLLGRESTNSQRAAGIELNDASQGNPLLSIASGVAGSVAQSGGQLPSFGSAPAATSYNYGAGVPGTGYGSLNLNKIKPFR